MSKLTDSQETYCSEFEDNLKKKKPNINIKHIQSHLREMQLKLTNTKKKLSASELILLKNEILQIKDKYWVHLHLFTKKAIDRKLILIDSKLSNDCSKFPKNDDVHPQSTLKYKKKIYKTRKRINTTCCTELCEKPQEKCIKPKRKNVKQKFHSQNVNGSNPGCKPGKTLLYNTCPMESSGSNHNLLNSKPKTITSPNVFEDNFLELQQKNSKLNWENLKSTGNSVHSDNGDQEISDNQLDNLSIADLFETTPNVEKNCTQILYCLTEQQCRKLARSLKLDEEFLIYQIKSIVENEEADEFDDVSVIGPSQSPINHETWKTQRLKNMGKVCLNTELEHFKNNFQD